MLQISTLTDLPSLFFQGERVLGKAFDTSGIRHDINESAGDGVFVPFIVPFIVPSSGSRGTIFSAVDSDTSP